MQLSGDYTFDAPQALVWQALQDPQILGSVMPGGKGFQEDAPNEFSGVLSVKVGPVNGTFNGKIALSDVVPPESYSIRVEGSGPQGHVTGGGSLKLEPLGEQTHMVYQGAAQVGGRIASVGQRLIDASAKSIIRQSLEGLNAYLKIEVQREGRAKREERRDGTETPSEQVGHGDAAVNPLPLTPYPLPDDGPSLSSVNPQLSNAVPAYTPPSQTSVALNVAADVARDLVPAPIRPILLGVGLLGVGLLLWWWLR